jgi:hypothetical protein
MENKIYNCMIGFLIICLLATSGFAQDHKKLAQTGFQFLSVVSDARAASMAEAMTSLQINSSALFFNPAGMSNMTNFIDITASTNKWIADITHNTFGMAINPTRGKYGVFGFSIQSVDYGDFYGTRVLGSDFEDTGVFSLSALAIGGGYAKQLTDRFSVGGQIRWIHQDLGDSYIPVSIRPDPSDPTGTSRMADTSLVENTLSPWIYDFGLQFNTGIHSLTLGMSVRNFSQEVKYAEEGFQAPLVFSMGLSMNMLDLLKEVPYKQALYLCVDASHYRDHPEQIKVGVDYNIMQVLSLRGGYIANNDESGFSFGFGVTQFGCTFDYAFTPFGVFDKVQRLTARISL